MAREIGFLWLAAVMAYGVWLGIDGLFFGGHGLVFKDGTGDIWILAILASPGVFLWKWGSRGRGE